MQIRIFEPEEHKIYTSSLLLKHNATYAHNVRDAPELIGKTLHYWDLPVTYQTLSLKEMQSSVERANAINLLNDCDALEHCVSNLATRPTKNKNMNDSEKTASTTIKQLS